MKDHGRIFSISERLEERIFLIFCAGIALSIPLKASWNSFVCILLIVFWIFFQRKKFNLNRVLTVLLISILFFLALIGLLYTANLKEGLFRLQQKSILLIFPLIFCSAHINFDRLITVVSTSFILGMFTTTVFSLFKSFLAWQATDNMQFFFGHDLAEWLNIYPYVEALACLVVILLLIEAIKGRITLYSWLSKRPVLIFLILFFSLFILLLSVKQVILSWLAVATLYSIQSMKRWWYAALTLSFVLLALIAAVSFIPTLHSKVQQHFNSENNVIPLDTDASLGKDWNGVALRRAIWTCSIDVIKSNFWFGVGTGDGQDHLQDAYENRKFYFASRYNNYNAHNQYIQTLVNFGFIGLLIVISSLVVQVAMLKEHLIFVTFTICILSSFLTESMLETNKGMIVYGFFNPLLFYWKMKNYGKVYP